MNPQWSSGHSKLMYFLQQIITQRGEPIDFRCDSLGILRCESVGFQCELGVRGCEPVYFRCKVGVRRFELTDTVGFPIKFLSEWF